MKQTLFSRALLIWLLGAAFFFTEYFARVAPSVMVSDLMHDFHVDPLSLGVLSASFYYAYVGMQLPVGLLIDRYGPHKLLTVMAALCGLACFLFASSHTLAIANLARFLMGIAAAFAFVGALTLARNWFSPARFGLFAGTTQALGMLGAAVGEGPVALLVQHTGWRHTMVLIGLLLLGISILIACIVRDTPKSQSPAELNVPKHSLWKSLVAVLKIKQCWINGIYVGFLYAPTAAFAELWGASYLHRVYAIPNALAAAMVSSIFIGFAISSPFAGWLSDKIKRRKPIMLGSAILSFVFITTVLYVPHLSAWWALVLLFLYGMSNVAVSTSYAVASEIVPSDIASTSMSFANMSSVIVGAIFQPIIGGLLQWGQHKQLQNGLAKFSTHDFHTAMLSLPLCIIVSLIAWCFLKESYQS